MPNSAMACTSSPVEIAPVEMRHDPTATQGDHAEVGQGVEAGLERGPQPADARAGRCAAPSAAWRSRPTSRSSRPSDLTTSAPSNDSWATAATSPSRAWVVAAGASTRRL